MAENGVQVDRSTERYINDLTRGFDQYSDAYAVWCHALNSVFNPKFKTFFNANSVIKSLVDHDHDNTIVTEEVISFLTPKYMAALGYLTTR